MAITPTSSLYSYARSTAVAVLSANFSIESGKLNLDLDSLSDLVCRDQRFSKDPSLSYACTGFLVAPDLIATAGHCMVNTGESRHETDTYCEAFSWLFDYQSNILGQFDAANISSSKLYRCKEVIYAINESSSPFRDFALVRLDRPVKDRKPLSLNTNAVISGPLSMIGYPLGSPAKLSRGASILLNNPARQSFITNLDAFEGNSGSPVFNRKMEVIGILIAGNPFPSLIPDKRTTCERYNVCNEKGENCRVPDTTSATQAGFQKNGSEVQRIEPLKKLIDESI